LIVKKKLDLLLFNLKPVVNDNLVHFENDYY